MARHVLLNKLARLEPLMWHEVIGSLAADQCLFGLEEAKAPERVIKLGCQPGRRQAGQRLITEFFTCAGGR